MQQKCFKWQFYKPTTTAERFINFLNQQTSMEITPGITKRHQMISCDFEGKSYIIKRFSPSDNRLWARKIELTLKSYWISGAQQSFRGACWLWEAGIPGIIPTAWAVRGHGYHQVSYFVYERIEAQGEVKGFLQQDSLSVKQEHQLIQDMAKISLQVHQAGYRHTDIVPHNFLVQVQPQGQFKVLIIDTDKVKKTSIFGQVFKGSKLFFDLRCFRRLRLSPQQLSLFFHQYFQGDTRLRYLQQWYFWVNGGFNLYKRKKMKQRLPDNLLKLNLTLLLEQQSQKN